MTDLRSAQGILEYKGVFYEFRQGKLGLEIYDRKSGFWRNLNDCGRQGPRENFEFSFLSKKTEQLLNSRCPKSCPICHGVSPGCLPGSKHNSKMRRFLSYSEDAKRRFEENNQESLRRVAIMRTIACISYQKAFMFGTFLLKRVWIYPCRSVFKKTYFYKARLPFQNTLSEENFLTWLKEKNGVVLSPKQRRNLLCIGAISKVLARLLISHGNLPHLFRRFATFQQYLLGRLFGYGSLRRLILAGGLDWKYLESNKRFLNHYYICK